MTTIPPATAPINPSTGLPWTQTDVDALVAQVKGADTSLGGAKADEITADVNADAVADLGGDAAITDPAERVALGLVPGITPPPPVDTPPPDTTPTLETVAAHVDNLETRVSKLEAAAAPSV